MKLTSPAVWIVAVIVILATIYMLADSLVFLHPAPAGDTELQLHGFFKQKHSIDK